MLKLLTNLLSTPPLKFWENGAQPPLILPLGSWLHSLPYGELPLHSTQGLDPLLLFPFSFFLEDIFLGDKRQAKGWMLGGKISTEDRGPTMHLSRFRYQRVFSILFFSPKRARASSRGPPAGAPPSRSLLSPPSSKAPHFSFRSFPRPMQAPKERIPKERNRGTLFPPPTTVPRTDLRLSLLSPPTSHSRSEIRGPEPTDPQTCRRLGSGKPELLQPRT